MSYIVKVIPAPAGTTSTSVAYIPALGGTVVDLNSTQTLTNKTISNSTLTVTNATLTTPTLTGATINTATINTPTMTIFTTTYAATGGNIATANAITLSYPGFILITAANGTNGVQLPVAAAGKRYVLQNSPAANAAVRVYPQVNSQINEAGSNTSLTIAANSTCELIAYNATHWYSNPKVPS
jgi:hypothetical protein